MSSNTDNGPRLIVTADDHRAIIVIVVVICLLWSIFVITARGIWRLHQKSDFGLDDTVATLGTIISAAQAGVTLAAVHFGFGKRASLVSDDNVSEAGQYLYAGALLYVLGMCASRASMPLLIARLTRERTQAFWSRILLGVTALWGFASTLAIAFECGVPVPFLRQAEATCSGLFAAWTAIEVLGLLLEVGIIALAVGLVANLQMQQRFKIAVVGSFCLRALLIIPVAFRLDVLRKTRSSASPFFEHVNLEIVTQLVLHYSLWAASFPCMRAFLRAFDTGMGVTTHVSTHKGSNYGLEDGKGSYAMGSISREKRETRMASTSVPVSPITPTDKDTIEGALPKSTAAGHRTQNDENREGAKGRPSDETASESSRRAIITRTVEWQINYEEAPGRAI